MIRQFCLCSALLAFAPSGMSPAHAQSSKVQGLSDAFVATSINSASFPGGRFVRASGGEWIEIDANNRVRYEFREIAARNGEVQLRNDDLDVDIWIDADRRVIEASWPDHARAFLHPITDIDVSQSALSANPPTVPPPAVRASPASLVVANYDGGRFERGGASGRDWTEVKDTGPADRGRRYRFRTVGSDASRLYLHDRARDVMVAIDIPARSVLVADQGGEFRPRYTLSTFRHDAPEKLAPIRPREGLAGSSSGVMDTNARTACLASGGEVVQAGRARGEVCVRPTSDAGKICSDSAECESTCRATDDGPVGARARGVCHSDTLEFGCYTRISGGVREPMICVD